MVYVHRTLYGDLQCYIPKYRYVIPSPSIQLLEVDFLRLDICLNGRLSTTLHQSS
jgi:hypothetical protein